MGTIFTNNYDKTQTLSAQGAIIQYGKGGGTATGVPLILQNITISYSRRITPIYPINTDADSTGLTKFNIASAPQGALSWTGIYAPNGGNIAKFFEELGKPCKGPEEAVTIIVQPFGKGNCGGWTMDKEKLTLSGVELEQLQFSIQGGEAAIVNMPITCSFTSLKWESATK